MHRARQLSSLNCPILSLLHLIPYKLSVSWSLFSSYDDDDGGDDVDDDDIITNTTSMHPVFSVPGMMIVT